MLGSVVKCKLSDPDGLPGGDKLETLHHARHGLVLQTGILCLRLLLVLDDLRPLLVLDDLLPFLVLDGLLLLVFSLTPHNIDLIPTNLLKNEIFNKIDAPHPLHQLHCM